MTIKMSDAPKGATHWQPRSDFSYESFYKKTSHGVSVFVVNQDSNSIECNRWNSELGRNHTEVATVIPIELINQHDHLQSENKRLREALNLLVGEYDSEEVSHIYQVDVDSANEIIELLKGDSDE